MATLIFALCIVFSLCLAFYALKAPQHNAEDFFVGSRQFGSILTFFLAAGEIYSIGVLIGLPSGIYIGGPSYAVWYLGYMLLCYPLGYFILPKLWALGKQLDCATLPDLFRRYYQSRGLELVVTITCVLFLLPWGQMQFTGLLTALNGLGWHLSPAYTMIGCAVLAFCYIATSGVRSSAYVAVFKDIMMILVVVLTGAAVIYSTGISHVFTAARQHVETRMTTPQLGFTITTIMFQAIGLVFFPLSLQSTFSARSANTIRRTQMFMPLYMLMFPFVILVAYYAVSSTHLSSPTGAFMAAATDVLPGWMLGIVAAGASLSGLLVLAVVCLTIGSMVTRNLIPGKHVVHQRRTTRIVMVIYLAFSIVLTLATPNLMTTLVNTAYNGITQFAPGALAALFLRTKLRPLAVGLGILCGQGVSVWLYLAHLAPAGFNGGLIGLICNVIVVGLVQFVLSAGHKATPTIDDTLANRSSKE